jgi:hypothetical protein
MPIPYASATSGMKARDEITKMLQQFGCDSVGFMDNFEDKSVLLAFRHRGRQVQLKASAQGWANLWLKQNPWSGQRRLNKHDYEEAALNQGLVAVNSLLRDWVKGQITAVECGILSFEAVFMPHMLTDDGRPLVERMSYLLTAPQQGAM